MDAERVGAVLESLDEAERVLGEVRLHQHVGHGGDGMACQRARLQQARMLLDRAHHYMM